MTIASVVLRGYSISVNFLPTLGYGNYGAPSIPGVELSAGWQRPHYHAVGDKPEYSAGWRRPQYQAREET